MYGVLLTSMLMSRAYMISKEGGSGFIDVRVYWLSEACENAGKKRMQSGP